MVQQFRRRRSRITVVLDDRIMLHSDAVHSIFLLQGRHDYTDDTSVPRGLYRWLAEKPLHALTTGNCGRSYTSFTRYIQKKWHFMIWPCLCIDETFVCLLEVGNILCPDLLRWSWRYFHNLYFCTYVVMWKVAKYWMVIKCRKLQNIWTVIITQRFITQQIYTTITMNYQALTVCALN